ncbi:MAG: ferrochelatase [Chitinophagales bacterium]|nr:ferrochelatase [Chitinophagales bacterium]
MLSLIHDIKNMQDRQIGLLLTNLGSPTSSDVKSVRKFLTEFLMDKRVVDFPYWLRFLLVRGIISPLRAPKSSAAYKRIWTSEGSPLIIESERLAESVRKKVNYPVALSMNYGEPSTESAFEQLIQQQPDLKKVIVLPLYPHYTMSSFGSAVHKIRQVYQREKYPFQLKFLPPFYHHPDYISVLSSTIQPYLDNDYDKILFSYHGIPERHLRKDEKIITQNIEKDFQMPPYNYQKQAYEMSRLTAEKLGIPKEKYEVAFQSRLTPVSKQWLKPYTTNRLETFAQNGAKKILVVCPSFINDCLETLEEIGIEEKNKFELRSGGSLTLIPCINNHPEFVATIQKWVKEVSLVDM